MPSCLQVDTLDDALALVNENEHGNGCAIFTSRYSGSRGNVGQGGMWAGCQNQGGRRQCSLRVGESREGRGKMGEGKGGVGGAVFLLKPLLPIVLP